MTDTPIDTPAPNSTQQIRKRRRNTANRPLRINWRHRQFVTLYVARGLTEAPRCVMETGLAHDLADAEISARSYLRRAEIVELIREEIRGAGLTEAKVRENVTKWMDSTDPNASLRASELGARILGMLREPAPAVPQLPPLIVVQSQPALSQADTALAADYSVEEQSSPGPALVSLSETGPTTLVEARIPTEPQKTRERPPKAAEGGKSAVPAKRKKRPSVRNPGPNIPALLKAGRPRKTPTGLQYPPPAGIPSPEAET